MKTTLRSVEYALRSETYTINAIDEKFDELKNKDDELKDRIDKHASVLKNHDNRFIAEAKLLKEHEVRICQNDISNRKMLWAIYLLTTWLLIISLHHFATVAKTHVLEKRLDAIESTTIEEVEP